MAEKEYVIKGRAESKQIITNDTLFAFNNIVDPFFSFEKVLDFYYANTYHRLCINIKSRILSMIEKSDLDKYVQGSTRAFLQQCLRDLEIYGNMFIEVAGTQKYRAFYYLPTIEARIDKNFDTYQVLGFKKNKIEAKRLSYSSPKSRFYGEPDYLATINPILVNQNIDLYNSVFFENGGMPDLGIIFENCEPSDEQITAFKDFFQRSFRGAKNAHRSLIMSAQGDLDGKEARIRIEKLNEIKDLSFEKLKGINRDDIIAAHNVPPRLAGIVNSGGWGGQGEFMGQLHAFNEICIQPKQEAIQEFFDGLGVKVKLKSFDITTFKDDSEVIPQLIQMGIISMQEGREILGYRRMQNNKGSNNAV